MVCSQPDCAFSAVSNEAILLATSVSNLQLRFLWRLSIWSLHFCLWRQTAIDTGKSLFFGCFASRYSIVVPLVPEEQPTLQLVQVSSYVLHKVGLTDLHLEPSTFAVNRRKRHRSHDNKWPKMEHKYFFFRKKVHCVLHAFMRTVSPLATWRTKSDLYKSMVLSIINYCSPVWSPSMAALTKLEQVQNRATAWILSYDCAYTDILIFLKSIATDIELPDLRYFNLLEGSWWKICTTSTGITALSSRVFLIRVQTRQFLWISQQWRKKTEGKTFSSEPGAWWTRFLIIFIFTHCSASSSDYWSSSGLIFTQTTAPTDLALVVFPVIAHSADDFKNVFREQSPQIF